MPNFGRKLTVPEKANANVLSYIRKSTRTSELFNRRIRNIENLNSKENKISALLMLGIDMFKPNLNNSNNVKNAFKKAMKFYSKIQNHKNKGGRMNSEVYLKFLNDL